MRDAQPANLEQAPRFPSGAWTGFFLQYWLPGRHTTNLHLTCRDGKLVGEGRDWVGRYTIEGTYELATGRCEWKKQYIGKHSVAYRGVNDGHGIWGVWEIRILGGLYVDRGGFHLWPEGTDVSAESEQTERAVVEVMRREFGGVAYRLGRAAMITAAAAAGLVALWWCYGGWRY